MPQESPETRIASPGLFVQNLAFGFGKREVLKDISFALSPGENIALIGTNGAGKTTLLYCLTGYLKKKSGTITWDSEAVESILRSVLAKKIGILDSEDWGFVPFTVEELLFIGRYPVSGYDDSENEINSQCVKRIAEMLRLLDLFSKNFNELSKGEIQRVKLAMALAREPQYLLLDEPISHLDPFFQKEILSCFSDYAKNGMGVLSIIHDINLIRFFDRVLVLSEGVIFSDGDPRSVFERKTLDSIFGKEVFEIHQVNDFPVGLIRHPEK